MKIDHAVFVSRFADNRMKIVHLHQPFGGTKASGTGREGGTWSYEVFCEPKNIAVSMGSHHIPHWGVSVV